MSLKKHSKNRRMQQARFDHTVGYYGLQSKRTGQQSEQTWYYESDMTPETSATFDIISSNIIIHIHYASVNHGMKNNWMVDGKNHKKE